LLFVAQMLTLRTILHTAGALSPPEMQCQFFTVIAAALRKWDGRVFLLACAWAVRLSCPPPLTVTLFCVLGGWQRPARHVTNAPASQPARRWCRWNFMAVFPSLWGENNMRETRRSSVTRFADNLFPEVASLAPYRSPACALPSRFFPPVFTGTEAGFCHRPELKKTKMPVSERHKAAIRARPPAEPGLRATKTTRVSCQNLLEGKPERILRARRRIEMAKTSTSRSRVCMTAAHRFRVKNPIASSHARRRSARRGMRPAVGRSRP